MPETLNVRLKAKQGFSLVELLVVLVVIVLLSSLSVPALNKMLRSSNLNTAGRSLVDQLNYARETARAKSLPVEIRLYKLPDYGKDSTTTVTAAGGVYRGFQAFLLDENGQAVALGRAVYFQAPVVISAGAQESSLLSDTASAHLEQAGTGKPIAGYGTNYRYIPFLLNPGGSTDLSTGKNCLTLLMQNGKPLAQGANFFTVQIDTMNGAVRSFRP
jgi:uncharacterized protein (TIGR02596 family)